MTSRPGMYGDHAELYDLIYHVKDYDAEVARLEDLLRAEGVADSSRILDVACGTGEHLRRLATRYDATGLDLSEAMLAIARRKVPGVPLLRANLESFRVDRPFDALLCLFSSIGYAVGEDRLRAAAASFARALVPGGVLVVEPWIDPEEFRAGAGRAFLDTYSSDAIKIARASSSAVRGDVAVIEFRWVVAREGRGLESFEESHETWLCPRPLMAAIFEEAGFETRFEPDGLTAGRGLFLGRRRP